MYLFIDTETGGIDPQEVDLLQVGMVMVTDDFKVVSTIKMDIHPDSGIYRVTTEALRVNGIDLTNRGETYSYSEMRPALQLWLSQGTAPYVIAGWNVAFDVAFLKQYLGLSRDLWNTLFKYSTYDVQAVARFSASVGIIDPALGGRGMHRTAKALGYDIDRDAPHDALADAMATVFIATTLFQKGI
jgi:DNA polymerase III epsilon subunit-like protein